MIKPLLALLLAFFAAMTFAATEVNTATPAELDAIKGIGPSTAAKIVDERNKGPFKDWNDLVTRVKGVGPKNSAEFSAAGLTVNGAPMSGVAMAPPTARKTSAKATPTAAPAPATTAPAATPVAPAATPNATAATPMSAADRKAAAKQERDDKRAAKKAAKAASAAQAASASAK